MPEPETETRRLSPRPSLSVVVASCNSPEALERCLESLTAELPADGQLIVADCSTADPRPGFSQHYPDIRFLRFEEKLSIPELRREGIKAARGEIVALTEGRTVPSAGWLNALLEAHARHPEAAGVGGPIDHAGRSAFEWAVFFCEYGWHMPPAPEGAAELLSGANLSYKRWALEACWELIEEAAWEPFVHRRLEQLGHPLRRAGQAVVCYHNSLTAAQFLRQRFHYGRWFAAARVEGRPILGRLLYAAFTPLLPAVLLFRLCRLVFARGRNRAWFLRAFPWMAAFQMAWSLGECCGYLLGKGRSHRQVF